MALIKAIIGLGNPGLKFEKTRHNIGFRILNELARRVDGMWKQERNVETARVFFSERPVLLIKPHTFMNSSGQIIPALRKEGIKPENIIVVHDELELPFGKMALRMGGSHKGHNGIRSIIEYAGPDFMRLRFGIGRPEDREEVPAYVLRPFTEDAATLDQNIKQAADIIVAAVQDANGA